MKITEHLESDVKKIFNILLILDRFRDFKRSFLVHEPFVVHYCSQNTLSREMKPLSVNYFNSKGNRFRAGCRQNKAWRSNGPATNPKEGFLFSWSFNCFFDICTFHTWYIAYFRRSWIQTNITHIRFSFCHCSVCPSLHLFLESF